jgi:type I restriction enzyme S subunit
MELKQGYKQTDLGVIPDDWDITFLNKISVITRLAGYEYSSLWQETLNGEIIALRGFNIGENRIIEKDFVRISNSLSMRLKRSRLYKDDVIYPCVGTIGNAAVIKENDKYHIQQNIAKITPSKGKVNSEYLAYYLMSYLGLNEITKFNGTSSQPNILVGSLRRYSIIIPKLAEQTAIANALSDMDALISQTEKLIEKKKAIKQGAMQELLKPREGWVTKKLGDVGKCHRGVSYNPEVDLYKYDENNTVRLLRSNNIQQQSIDLVGLQFVGQSRVKPNQILQENDIVICMANGSKQLVGKAGVFSKSDHYSYTFGAFMGCFRTEQKFALPAFIALNFQTNNYRNHIDVLLSGSSINNLNPNNIESIEISLPTISDQLLISNIIGDMDKEIANKKNKLNKLKQQKQGMMQALLTGKIRLV